MKKINLTAPLNQLGFGLFSSYYYKALVTHNYDVSWNLIGHPNPADINYIAKIFDLNPENIDKDLSKPIHENTENFVIWHTDHASEYINHNLPKNRCLTHFETYSLSPKDIDSLKQFNQVFCCSTWGLSVLELSGIENIKKAPGVCISLETKERANEPVEYIDKIFNWLRTSNPDTHIMCSIGKYEQRKQQFKLIKALTISYEKPVILFAFWNNVFLNGLRPAINKVLEDFELIHHLKSETKTFLYCKHKKSNNIIVLGPFIENLHELHRFILLSDSFISISAGEGWDQPLIEALGLRKQSIISINSAHQEYINSNRDILVHCNPEIANDGQWFKGDRGYWYPPSNIAIENSISKIIVEPLEFNEKFYQQIDEMCSYERIIQNVF